MKKKLDERRKRRRKKTKARPAADGLPESGSQVYVHLNHSSVSVEACVYQRGDDAKILARLNREHKKYHGKTAKSLEEKKKKEALVDENRKKKKNRAEEEKKDRRKKLDRAKKEDQKKKKQVEKNLFDAGQHSRQDGTTDCLTKMKNRMKERLKKELLHEYPRKRTLGKKKKKEKAGSTSERKKRENHPRSADEQDKDY